MKKSHISYLRRIIGNAIAERNHAALTESVLSIKTPSTGFYQMMRDIICDARFYSVLDNDSFWKTYGAYKIGGFVDSLSSEEWNDDEILTIRKENFLNDWMASHMLPLASEWRKKIEMEIELKLMEENSTGMPDPDEHDGASLGIIYLGNGIKDTTNRTGEPADGLPPKLKDYMEDANGGSTPDFHNDGHMADARFLDKIDPSIVRLAEKIGRRGGNPEPVRGKFKPAPKSDINGITVGNDLNSILPSELALLASPASENVFLDRYLKKRLQIFSSVSETRKDKLQAGPIYVCIDTSGSMVDEPEILAKTLALAISIVAQRERRPVCIFNYSDNISFFVLKDISTQRRKLLRFLSESYGGGNDENKLFSFIFDKLGKLSSYREFANELKGADLLVISDFLWTKIEAGTMELIDAARNKGMRVFSIAIVQPQGYRPRSGFYLKSDFPYIYDDGKIKEDRR